MTFENLFAHYPLPPEQQTHQPPEERGPTIFLHGRRVRLLKIRPVEDQTP